MQIIIHGGINMKNNICGIYKITNQLNGNFYIGQSVNIYKRWVEHCRSVDSSPIHKAIQKYGKESFTLEILEECNKQELNDKEIFWISKYGGCYNPKCYNLTRGGDGSSHPVKLSHENVLEIINLLQTTNIPIEEIAMIYDVSRTTITSINNGNSRILEGYQYPIRENKYDGKHSVEKNTYEPQYTTSGKEIQEYHSIQVGQYNQNWELINIFPSIREAAREMKCHPESIRKALKSTTHRSRGFLWKEIINDK